MSYPVFKRFFDLLFAIVLGILFSPLCLIIAICIRLETHDSAFFTQERIGRNGKIFKVKKFRTMSEKKDENDILLPDSERITKTGNFLRKTSLDEIPQLINIIAGEMSFIGPRPLLVRYYPYFTPEENRRHLVRPGMTGLSAVNGRHLNGWNKRFGFDIEYVDNLSFSLDVKIFFLTAFKVLKQENVIIAADDKPILDLDEERTIKWR